ncbi:MAG: hypothetical protein K2X86_12930 [Cytophagaceae bacterium]|nr:hypothetical protein [Cytophagaceae bacterium]
MKNLNLISLFILSLFLGVASANAQEEWYGGIYKYGQKYPGYIIKLNGDTIQGHIEYLSRTELQNKCVFYSDPNNKKSKVVYKGEDLKGYYVADKFYKAMNYSGGLLAAPIRFLWKIEGGRIAQYKWFDQAENFALMHKLPSESQVDFEKRQYPSKLIIQKGDEKPFEHSSLGLNFSKKMSELVSDYPELSQKVANKEEGYGLLKMLDIITEYNKWYAEKNK